MAANRLTGQLKPLRPAHEDFVPADTVRLQAQVVPDRRVRSDGGIESFRACDTEDVGRSRRRGAGQRSPEPSVSAGDSDCAVQSAEGYILIRPAIPVRVALPEERLRSEGRLLHEAPGNELRLLRPGADRRPHVQGHPGRRGSSHVRQHGHGARPLHIRDAGGCLGTHGRYQLEAHPSLHGLSASHPVEGCGHVKDPSSYLVEGAGGDRRHDHGSPGEPVGHEGGQVLRRQGLRGVQVQRQGRRHCKAHLLGHSPLRIPGIPDDVHIHSGHRRDPLVRRQGSRRRQAHSRRPDVVHLLHGPACYASQDERVVDEHSLPRLIGRSTAVPCARRTVARE